jgi:hypothetical protein
LLELGDIVGYGTLVPHHQEAGILHDEPRLLADLCLHVIDDKPIELGQHQVVDGETVEIVDAAHFDCLDLQLQRVSYWQLEPLADERGQLVEGGSLGHEDLLRRMAQLIVKQIEKLDVDQELSLYSLLWL